MSEMIEAMGNKRRLLAKLNFPAALYHLLEDAENGGHTEIVSWIRNGAAFQVHRPDEFCELVMPHYFRQSKFRSFTRQVRPAEGVFHVAFAYSVAREQHLTYLLPFFFSS